MIQPMVRFSRFKKGLRPVHSIKHVVDIQAASVAGTQVNNVVIAAFDAPVLANVSHVETGCTVNSIYLKVEISATSTATLANAYMFVFKNPGGNLVLPTANAVGSDDNKKFVIHQEMVMLEKNTTSNPRTLFVGVLSIPRGYRRFGINDQLYISVLTPGVGHEACIQCIYKEYR